MTIEAVGSAVFGVPRTKLLRQAASQHKTWWYAARDEELCKAARCNNFERACFKGNGAGYSLTCPANDSFWNSRHYEEQFPDLFSCLLFNMRQRAFLYTECTLPKRFLAVNPDKRHHCAFQAPQTGHHACRRKNRYEWKRKRGHVDSLRYWFWNRKHRLHCKSNAHPIFVGERHSSLNSTAPVHELWEM